MNELSVQNTNMFTKPNEGAADGSLDRILLESQNLFQKEETNA